jgi:hypothetical protein
MAVLDKICFWIVYVTSTFSSCHASEAFTKATLKKDKEAFFK